MDDRWENRAVIQNLLEPLGFDILEADNGQEALEQLQTNQSDLVIADLIMPVMDGLEFLQRVRNSDELNHTPVIVSSASVSQTARHMALDYGGDDFLAKPVDASALFTSLAKQLQLTWIYETQEEIAADIKEQFDEVVLPPYQTLEMLLKFAQEADMKTLRERLVGLVASDQAHTSFAEPILQLSQQFKAEEIEVLLQRYLGEKFLHIPENTLPHAKGAE